MTTYRFKFSPLKPNITSCYEPACQAAETDLLVLLEGAGNYYFRSPLSP